MVNSSVLVDPFQFVLIAMIFKDCNTMLPGVFPAGPFMLLTLLVYTFFCLSNVDGSSLTRRESWRLNGDDSLNFWNPLKDPCLSNICIGACGLDTAPILSTTFTGTGSIRKCRE